MSRKPRDINDKELDYLLSLTEEDITLEELTKLFVNTTKTKAMFKPNDRLTLPANKLENKSSIRTTVGRYIVNLFLLTPNIIKHIGYNNETLDSGGIKDLEKKIAALLLDDHITSEDFINYIDKSQWLGYSVSHLVSPGFSYDIIVPQKSVMTKKKQLVKENIDELEKDNPAVATAIEKELTKMAEENLRDKEVVGMEYFDSGTSKGFGNNYKNTSIMRGAIVNNSEEGKFRVSDSNLIDGIDKEDFHKYADLPVTASYSRAVGTQQGGYLIIITCSPCKTKLL